MSNVTKIERPSVIWVCGCGCSSFFIREDGEAECCMCGKIADADGQGWYDRTKDQHARADDLDGPITDINGNGSMEFVRRRVAQLASDEGAALLIVVRQDGSVSTWSMAETEEQLDWVSEQVTRAEAMIRRNVTAPQSATHSAKSNPGKG